MGEQDGRTIFGTIPYNKRSVDLGGFVEQIAPGAFDGALQPGADVRCIYNHGTSDVLGRTSSGTLALSSDTTGLHFRCSLPNTQVANDVAELVRRKDVSAVSFGFRKIEDDWSKDADGQRVRTLRKVNLYEISPTSFPAYPDASAALRSCPPGFLTDVLSESERNRLQLKLALRLRN